MTEEEKTIIEIDAIIKVSDELFAGRSMPSHRHAIKVREIIINKIENLQPHDSAFLKVKYSEFINQINKIEKEADRIFEEYLVRKKKTKKRKKKK